MWGLSNVRIAEYKKYFGEHTQTKYSSVQSWTDVVSPLRDAPVNEQGYNQLADAASYAKKGTGQVLGLMSQSNKMTALCLANLAHQCGRSVTFVSPEFFAHLTINRLSSLFAGLESHPSILFFDEADALFGKTISYQDTSEELDADYFFKLLENYQGLVVLDINDAQSKTKLELRKKQVVELG